jgi:predicted GIY-YIG superfamily endonuclease
MAKAGSCPRATARQAKEISERRLSRRSFFAEADLSVKYVYILQSEQDAEHFYSGITDDLDARLSRHNSGEVPHTAKYRPWRIKSYVAFTDDTQAFAFEKYLKSGSGRAFARKRL